MKQSFYGVEVKHYASPDVENLWSWQPESNCVFFLLEMNIGLVGETATDVYTVIIATPEGVSSLAPDSCCFNEVHKIMLVKNYSWERVKSRIEAKLFGMKGLTESDVLFALRSLFYWEYEGMK